MLDFVFASHDVVDFAYAALQSHVGDLRRGETSADHNDSCVAFGGDFGFDMRGECSSCGKGTAVAGTFGLRAGESNTDRSTWSDG